MSVQVVKRRAKASDAGKPWIPLIVTACGSVALMVALFFAASFLILQKDLSADFLPIFAYVCCAIPAFLCGLLGAKRAPRHKAILGMLSALPMLLALLIFCLAFYKTVGSGFGIAVSCVLLSAALGAGLAVRRKPKKRKYR